MAKSAAQWTGGAAAAPARSAQVIDIRTRQPWRPPTAPAWPFLADVLITLVLVTLGAWLFIKMRGG